MNTIIKIFVSYGIIMSSFGIIIYYQQSNIQDILINYDS
jgi:hypothetical protein